MKSKYMGHHLRAWNSLKKIVKIDPQIIFTSITEALLRGTYPYLSLYLVNLVIDSLLNKKMSALP
ncbi:hypothetical protein, partial [Bacillus licheniformis]|uniref:hypothetical protein n=1 Tax=Bacillus licheniformis TaxID=1402 RepID=UPI001C8AF9E2